MQITRGIKEAAALLEAKYHVTDGPFSGKPKSAGRDGGGGSGRRARPAGSDRTIRKILKNEIRAPDWEGHTRRVN